jgi:hypothetical protein
MIHLFHAIIITVISYFVMMKVLDQSSDKACGRSLIVGSLALIYMVMFGHDFPPTKIKSYLL